MTWEIVQRMKGRPILTPYCQTAPHRSEAEDARGARTGSTRGARGGGPPPEPARGRLRLNQIPRPGARAWRAPGEPRLVSARGQGARAQAAAHEERRRGGRAGDLRAGRPEALLLPPVREADHQQAGT